MLTVGSSLLTVELLCLQLCLGAFLHTVRACLLTVGAFLRQVEACFTYRGKVPLKSTCMDCKQRSSLVSKEVQLQVQNLPPNS